MPEPELADPMTAAPHRPRQPGGVAHAAASGLGRFEIFGPFDLPLTVAGRLDLSSAARTRFWMEVEGRESGLGSACGCFVFSVRNGRQTLPWYVGRAESQPFADHCLGDACLPIYARALEGLQPYCAHLHLLAKLTPTGHPSRAARHAHAEIAFIERVLIDLALTRNPQLMNYSDDELPRSLCIPGLLNPQDAPLTIDARALRSILGL
ncbi:MAG: hypothetical protein ACREVL_05245 [Solimonas sp.]